MALLTPSPEQLNCPLTPARARAVLAEQKLGADLYRYLTPDEASAVDLLFQADAFGSITQRAVVARIAACEAEAYPLARALVLFNALTATQRNCVAQACGSAELPAVLAEIEADPDTYADLTGLDLGSGLPLWRISIAADVTRYGKIERRAATLEEALASITTDDVDETPMDNGGELFGYRIVDAERHDDEDSDDADEYHDLDRPLGGLEVHVRRVGEVAALQAVVADLLALEVEGFGPDDVLNLIKAARERIAPFAVSEAA